MPTVATYNLRSLFPKINSFKTDMLEREVDCAFLCEIWENVANRSHQYEIEKLLELNGLKYHSFARSKSKRGVCYGGAALVVNLKKYSCEQLQIQASSNLEVVWCLHRPKHKNPKVKKIIACAFYSPPSQRKNRELADHIVTTLHLLYSKYPDSAIILGGDRNSMDIQPILNCGLRLRQVVDKFTRKKSVLDVIIMNTFNLYKSAIVVPPICPDDPSSGEPSDHSVPICYPHTDRFSRPQRNYKTIKHRPLPESGIRQFGQWLVLEPWLAVDVNLSPSEQVSAFETTLSDKLNECCPMKETKFSSHDTKIETT